jgi:cytochrome c oxidase subunit II
VGLQLPKRAAVPVRRVATGVLVAATLLFLSACDAADNDQIARLAMPEPITEQGTYTYDLWRWAWLAAIIVGIIVWGLIFWVVVRYRRRHDDEIPVQTRYNLPLEIFYTIAPIMMVIVFFYWTVNVQNKMVDLDPEPDTVIDVVGQQWSWTFNYTEQGEDGQTPYTAGTASQIPTLVLPVDQTIQFNLHSPDVIHNFGVPSFLTRMDVIPGRVNKLQVTPTVEGTYAGKCYELCGVYHSRMLFNVKVVSQEEYDAYVAGLVDEFEAEGRTPGAPALGGEFASTQTGLESGDESEEGAE